MPLIIEDGTGVDGAEAFSDVAAYDAFLSAYYDEASPATEAAKEAAIRRAVAFMNGLDWLGEQEAGLCFPRDTSEGIPEAVIFAQHVYTRAELAEVGSLSPSVTLQGEKVLNQVGQIGWEVISAPNTVDAKRPVVTMALDALKGLLATDYSATGGKTSLLLRS